jgi:hypothetical protein
MGFETHRCFCFNVGRRPNHEGTGSSGALGIGLRRFCLAGLIAEFALENKYERNVYICLDLIGTLESAGNFSDCQNNF